MIEALTVPVLVWEN